MATKNKTSKVNPKSSPKRKKKVKPQNQGTSLYEFISDVISSVWEELWQMIVRLYKQERGRLVLGVTLIFLSIFLFIPTASHIMTGTADQNLLHGGSGQDIIEVVDTDTEQQAANPLAIFGAKVGSYLFNDLFGWGSFIFIALLFYWGVFLMWRRHLGGTHLLSISILLGVAAVWVSIFMATVQFFLGIESDLLWGGEYGSFLVHYAIRQIGTLGLILALFFMLLIVLMQTSDTVFEAIKNPKMPRRVNIPKFMNRSKQEQEVQHEPQLSLIERLYRIFFKSDAEEEEREDDEEFDDASLQESDTRTNNDAEPPVSPEVTPLQPTQSAEPQKREPQTAKAQAPGDLIVEDARQDDLVEIVPTRPTNVHRGMQLVHYTHPSIDLLRNYEDGAKTQDKNEIEQNKQKIIDTLASFRTPVRPYKATIGPTVTLYEVIPEQGVKVSRIKSMEDDIALGLASEGIRIIAPMPGKGTIGIEVPNSTPQTVSMRTIMASRRFNELREGMQLPIGIGKTITNDPFVFDLAKMPHLLIAGATGQGKSVGLNAMITSLLYCKRPEELKFVLVDPKMLEFSIYAPLEKHFMAKLPDAENAIITDMNKVVPTLLSLCVEMDNRYRLLSEAKVKNIFEYNNQVRAGVNVTLNQGELMPYIVLIVDEFADLIMTSGKEVEQPIARLAQKARAAGIHMVIATQRPSTDVITGLIKANFPARIAFKVFSMIDSRTILDSPGANQLVGRGDMLFYQGKDMIRVQCAFLDTPETEEIVAHICEQQAPAQAYELPEYVADSDNEPKSFNAREKDPLFEEVARLVVSSQVGSTSNIQRKFNLGYNRAGRLMDQLEGAGIVSPQDGSKPREVYIKDLLSLEQLLEQLR